MSAASVVAALRAQQEQRRRALLLQQHFDVTVAPKSNAEDASPLGTTPPDDAGGQGWAPSQRRAAVLLTQVVRPALEPLGGGAAQQVPWGTKCLPWAHLAAREKAIALAVESSDAAAAASPTAAAAASAAAVSGVTALGAGPTWPLAGPAQVWAADPQARAVMAAVAWARDGLLADVEAAAELPCRAAAVLAATADASAYAQARRLLDALDSEVKAEAESVEAGAWEETAAAAALRRWRQEQETELCALPPHFDSPDCSCWRCCYIPDEDGDSWSSAAARVQETVVAMRCLQADGEQDEADLEKAAARGRRILEHRRNRHEGTDAIVSGRMPIPSASAAWMFLAQLCPKHPEQLGFLQLSPADTSPLERQPPAGSDSTASPHGTAGGVVPPLSPAATWLARARQLAAVAWRRLAAAAAEEELQQEEPGAGSGAGGLSGPPEGPGPAWTVFREAMRGLLLLLGLRGKGTTVPAREQMTDPLDWPHDQEPPPDPLACAVLSVYFNFWQEFGVPRYKSLEAGSVDWPAFVPSVLQMYDMIRFVQLPLDLQDLDGQPLHAVAAAFDVVRQPPPRRLSDAALLPLLDTLEAPNLLIEQLSRAAVWKTATVGVLQQRVGTRGAAAAQAASAMAAAAAAAAARATATAAAATAGGSAGLSPRLRSGSRQQAEPPTGVEWECERVVVEAAEVLAHEALQGGPVNVGERLGLARDAEVALKVLAWMRDNDYTQSWTDEYDESEGLDEDEGESEGEEVEAEYVADDQPHVGLDAAPASSIAQRQRQQQWQQQQLDGGTGLGEHSTIEDEALDEWEEAADAGEEGGFESGAAAEATVSALRAGCSGGRSDGGANLPTWKALLRPQQLPVTEAAAGHSRATAAASSSPAASSNAVTAAAAASAGNSNGGTGNGAAVAGAAAVAAASTAGELQDWLLPLQAGLYDALYLSEAPAADEPADDLAAAAAAAAAATATATANAASAAAAAAAQLGSVSYALKILRTADAYGLLHPDPHVLATVAPLPVAASAQQQAACAASRAAAPPPLTALRQLLEKVHETHVALGQHMLRGVASAIVGAQAAVSNTATASGATATAAAATANVNAATLTRACQQTVSQHATAVICQGLRPALANMDACVLAGLEPSEGATVQKRAQQVQQGLLKAIEALGAAKRELDRVMASAGKEATAAPEAAVTAATAAAIAAATAAVDLVQELQPRLLEAHPRSWGQLAMMVRKGWTHNSILHLLLCVVWGLQLVQPLLPPVTAAGMPPREAWLGLAPLAAAGAVYAAEKQAARHRTAAGVAEAAPPGAPPTPHGPPVASAVPQYALAGSDAVRSGFCGAGVYAFLAYASLLHCPPLSELPTHPGWLGSLASWELRHPPQPQAQPGLQPPPPRALQLFPAATLHSAQQCLRGLARGPLALRAALCHYLHMRAFILATGLPADHPAHEADCYTRLAVLAAASACWQVAVRGDAVRQRLEQENGLEEAEGQEAAAAEEEAKALRFLTQVKSIRVQDEEDEQDDTQQQELQQQEQQLQQGWEGPDAAGMAAPHRRGEGEQDGEQEERQELQILDITTTSSAGVGGAASGGSSPDRPPGLSHRVRLVPRRAKRGPQPQPLLPPAAETQPTAAAGAALAATSTVPPAPVAAALTGAAVPPPLPPPPPPSRVLYCLGPGVPPLLMAQALMHGVLVCLRVTLPQPLMQRLLDAAAPPHSAATPGSQPPPPPPPPELDAQLLRQHLNEYRQRQLDVARLHGLPEVDLMVSGPAHATLALLYLQIHPAVIGSAPYWLGFQPEAVAAAPDPGGSKAAGSGPPAGPAAVLLRGLRPVLLPVQMHKEGHSFYKWNLIPRVTVNTTSKLADQARAVRDTLTAHRLAMVRVDGAAAMPRALHLTLLVRQALLSQGRDCYVGCSEVWPSGFDTRAQKRDGETDRNCGGSGYGRGGGRGSGSDSEGDDDMRSPCRRLTGAVVNLHEHLLQTRRFMRKKPLPGAPHRSGAAAATAAVSADDGADAADAEGLDWMDVATRDRCEERIMRDMHSVLQLLGGGDGGGDAAARSSVSAAAAPGLAEGSVAAAPSRAAAALGLVLCIVECEPDLEQLAALAPGAAAAAAAATAGGSGSGSSGSPARMAPGTIIFPPHGKPGAVAAAGAAGAAQYGQTGAAASASNTGAAAAARAKGAEKASGRGLGKKALQRALFDK